MAVDRPRLEAAVREMLAAAGEDPTREGLLDTPRRVATMYEELLCGINDDPGKHLSVTFTTTYDEIVMVKDIAFASLCEHHILPFTGKIHVAYIPGLDGRITGLSKLVRLVNGFARRLQVQERLTAQIADCMESVLAPRGVLVVIEAEHLCMSMRGVRIAGTTTITSAVRGLFRDQPATRSEALGLLRGSNS